MKRQKYDTLRELYPEYVSLDQMRIICMISKRSARYLVEQEIVPAIDTGKQTWKYRIALDDIITYLHRRGQVGSMIPCGLPSGHKRGTKHKRMPSNRKSFAQLIESGQQADILEFFEYICVDCDDLLRAEDVADIVGLSKSSIMRSIKAGRIKYLMDRCMYFIPKQYLMEYVVSRHYIEIKSDSELFLKILRGFEIWKNAKSSR